LIFLRIKLKVPDYEEILILRENMRLPNEVVYFIAGLICYFTGAIPFGYILVKLVKGVDIRNFGSGNIGATNVARILGKGFFPVILLLDASKGFIPLILIPPFIVKNYPCGYCFYLPAMMLTFCALMTLLGHLLPVYLGFKGGKGVATGFGIIMAINYKVGLLILVCWIAGLLFTRYVSVASMLGAIFTPILYIILDEKQFRDNIPVTFFLIICAIFVIVRHRANIKRLLKGTEPRAF
jgi:glycerol-3-phosphate acyltransferase PlsY